MNPVLKQTVNYWRYLEPLVLLPKNQNDYEFLVSCLDELLDLVGEDEKHPLMSLVDFLSQRIEMYENQELQKLMGRGLDALKYLIKEHQLSQKDFAGIASQGVMSEILNGKRKLNTRQIKLLAERFQVNPETFMDE